MKDLSARQHQVAEFLVTGAENKVIAQQLGIDAQTVKTHVTRMLLKFGVQNRTQFAVKFDRMQREV
jgi:DNA-binding NarL/FixJ family response regulator